MKLRFVSLTLLVALLSAFTLAPMSASAAPKGKNALKNLPVAGALEDGRSFTGKLTITEVGYDAVEGLTISGALKGLTTRANGRGAQRITQSFENVPATLAEGASASRNGAKAFQAQQTCDILFLDLGPLNLDLLGLTIDLSQIVLDINAVSGPGNLLGNLLCGIVGLLDPLSGLLNFLGDIGNLLDFLGDLNDLLS